MIRTAAVRLAPSVGAVDANRASAVAAIERAAASGAELIVLPELAVSGGMFATLDEVRAAAEPLDGPTVASWRALAARLGVVVVGGLCEDDGGILRNTAVAVDGSGLRGAYRKLHMWAGETWQFTAGDRPAPVVETAAGRIGLAVCYDLWFPEVIRSLALAGADVVALPANLTHDEPQEGLPHVYVMTAIGAAHVNRVHLVLADRCGTDRGHHYLGAALVIDAAGRLVASAPSGDAPAQVLADLDLEQARDKRWGPDNDILGDRRPRLYPDVFAPRD